MEYPLLDVPVIGGGLLVAGVATLHVFDPEEFLGVVVDL
jgi:hypothetical protein